MAKLVIFLIGVALLVAVFNGIGDKIKGRKTLSRRVAGWYFKSVIILVGVPLVIVFALLLF